MTILSRCRSLSFSDSLPLAHHHEGRGPGVARIPHAYVRMLAYSNVLSRFDALSSSTRVKSAGSHSIPRTSIRNDHIPHLSASHDCRKASRTGAASLDKTCRDLVPDSSSNEGKPATSTGFELSITVEGIGIRTNCVIPL